MIDKQLANQIGREAEEALREVAERHGLTVAVRGGTYDVGSFKPKIEFKTADADATGREVYRRRICGRDGSFTTTDVPT